nr:hypothetical protein HK105_005334 [Polyrhizophydium stewartii]
MLLLLPPLPGTEMPSDRSTPVRLPVLKRAAALEPLWRSLVDADRPSRTGDGMLRAGLAMPSSDHHPPLVPPPSPLLATFLVPFLAPKVLLSPIYRRNQAAA